MKTTGNKSRLLAHRPTRLPILVVMFVALCCTAFPSPAATNELTTLLQKGLFEEEANRNLDGAKRVYESVITQFDQDREMAATAMFRMGEVLRKQGKTNESRVFYERVVREFPEQKSLVALSQQFAGLSSWTPPPQPDPETILKEAEADRKTGKYADALAKHVWFFENAAKIDEKHSMARWSALGDWEDLGSVYPPALAKLKAVRDSIQKGLVEGETWRDPFPPFMDFSNINRELEETERTKELFLWLHKNRPSAAKQIYHVASSVLIAAGEFEVCGNYVGASSFDSILQSYQFSKRYSSMPPTLVDHYEKSFRQQTATLVALLALNKRHDEANQIVKRALAEVSDPDFNALLEEAKKGVIPKEIKLATVAGETQSGAPSNRAIPTRTLRVPPIGVNEESVFKIIVLDNSAAELTGNWTKATAADSFGGDAALASSSETTNASSAAIYRPTIPAIGNYYVEVWHSSGKNRSPATAWEVVTTSGVHRFSVDQTMNGGQWVRAEKMPFTFYPGTNGYVKLSNRTGKSGETIVADAVRLVPVQLDVPESQSASRDSGSFASLRAETQSELLKVEPLLASLRQLPKKELAGALFSALPTPDSQLSSLLIEKAQATQKLTGLRVQYGEDHPNVRQAVALEKAIDEQVETRVVGIIRGLEARVAAAKMRLEQMDKAEGSTPSPSTESGNTATSEETEEIRRIQALIKNSPDLINAVNVMLGDGKDREIGTLLHEAARKGQVSVARFLIEKGANPKGRTLFLNTPLHIAAAYGHKTIAQLLVQHGAEVNATNSAGETALHVASSQGHLLLVTFFVEAGANINGSTDFGYSPLYRAANMGHLPVVEYLINKGADVNAKTRSGSSALSAAIGNGKRDVAELLIRSGADTNATEQNGQPLIWEAVKRKMPTVVDLLIERGADLRVRGDLDAVRKGWSLLHIAVLHGDVETIKVLLKHNADVNAKVGEFEQAPLHLASPGVHQKEIVSLLIAAKADLNSRMSEGRTPLHIAAFQRDAAENATMLVKSGADVNVQDVGGNTPLHYAAHHSQKVTRLLLEAGANPNFVNTQGETPLSRAEATAPELVELLLKYGADENLARRSKISISRNGLVKFTPFKKHTNLVGQFTLCELLADFYGHKDRMKELPFPDFANIRISRLDPNSSRTNLMTVDVQAILASSDRSKDVSLQWGDIVEVPEQEHSLNASWAGMTREVRATFDQLLKREVAVKVKGKTTVLILYPSNDFLLRYYDPKKNEPTEDGKPIITSFWLQSVLQTSGLLLSSSDLTRIAVNRNAGKQILVDLKNERSPFFVWLQDGDVIEVPDRDPKAAPQVSSPPVELAPEPRAIQTRTLRTSSGAPTVTVP